MAGGCTAAAADNVQEACSGKFLDHDSHLRRSFVVFTKLVRQAGIGVRGYVGAGLVRQLFQIGAQFFGAKGAVKANGDRVGVAHRVPECLGGLAGQGAAGGVGDGAGNHDRQFDAIFLEHLLNRKDRSLGVQGVEDGLDQDQVGAAFDQAAGSLGVVLDQLVKGDVTITGVVDVR